MAVNVTQNDAILREIIEYCENRMAYHRQFAYPTDSRDSMFHAGWYRAYDDVLQHCRSRLGYSGSMPLEVPNQSEQEHVMSTRTNCVKVGDDWWDEPVHECSCGYSTRDDYEARSHINVQEQLVKGMN